MSTARKIVNVFLIVSCILLAGSSWLMADRVQREVTNRPTYTFYQSLQ